MTWWEWGTEKQYLHDLIASDRRHPTVNAYGPLFGSPEYSTDLMPMLDPKTHQVTTFKMPVRDPNMPAALGPGHAASLKPLAPSPYWGDEQIWDTRANNHNGMFDKQGRVWFAATVRGVDNPDFCKKGSDHPSAKVFPLDRSSRQVTRLDPKTMQYTFVDTCFGTHHPQFGYDANDTLWLSGTGRWPVGSTPKCSTRPVMRRSRRAGPRSSSIPTAMGSATNTSSRTSRRPDQGQAVCPRFGPLCRDAEPGGRLDLVHRRRVRRYPGGLALCARNGPVGNLQRVLAWLRHPWR